VLDVPPTDPKSCLLAGAVSGGAPERKLDDSTIEKKSIILAGIQLLPVEDGEVSCVSPVSVRIAELCATVFFLSSLNNEIFNDLEVYFETEESGSSNSIPGSAAGSTDYSAQSAVLQPPVGDAGTADQVDHCSESCLCVIDRIVDALDVHISTEIDCALDALIAARDALISNSQGAIERAIDALENAAVALAAAKECFVDSQEYGLVQEILCGMQECIVELSGAKIENESLCLKLLTISLIALLIMMSKEDPSLQQHMWRGGDATFPVRPSVDARAHPKAARFTDLQEKIEKLLRQQNAQLASTKSKTVPQKQMATKKQEAGKHMQQGTTMRQAQRSSAMQRKQEPPKKTTTSTGKFGESRSRHAEGKAGGRHASRFGSSEET
jgi:hypothetical protein